MGFLHVIQISRHDSIALDKNLTNFADLTGVTRIDRLDLHHCARDGNTDAAGAIVVSRVDRNDR